MKKVLVLIAFLVGMQVSFASLTWDSEWNCDQLPNAFNGQFTQYVGGNGSFAIVEQDGANLLRSVTPAGTDSAFYTTNTGVWADTDSTIELRLKTGAFATSKYDIFSIAVISNSDGKQYGFRWGRNSSGAGYLTQVRTTESSTEYYNIDTSSDYRTYRMLYYSAANKAELYVKNGTAWDFLLMSDGSAMAGQPNFMRVGDGSSSYGGTWLLDYQYVTQQGATLAAIPEPATMAIMLLGMFGLNFKRK